MNRAEQLAWIEHLLSKYERKTEAAFLEGVRVVQDSARLSEIEAALRNNSPTNAAFVLQSSLAEAGFISFSRTLADAMIAGGDFGQRIASASRIEFGFNMAESNTARFMSDYQARLIRDINQDIRQTISQIIYREASAGKGPIQTAKLIRDSIGLTSTQESHVNSYRASLENNDKRALERLLRDKRFDPSVARMLEEGKPLSKDKIDKMVDAYRRRYLSRRAQTIARTETTTMISSGTDLYWKQMTDAGIVRSERVYKKWIYTHDGHTRASHVAIPRMNPEGVGLKEAFKSPLGLIRYPGDPNASAANRINCRCALFYRIKGE